MHSLTLLAAVVALVVGVIALTRSTVPTYTAKEKAAAKAHLCDRYVLAAHGEHIETTTPNNIALARISATNGALILETTAAAPALEPTYREAAQALAASYQTFVAIATTPVADDPRLQAAIDDSTDKDRTMKGVCGE
ncbi:hypothetical protein [[Mycobacterium] vasticus]|uniref:Uncharacterized protein n=1 Tax=[Mycobacterium] vasticus TaxID=2875777 RepID=A0ABU5Z365_9MYCO|nr:hypothetical protein [Mycolicibacter sp. MYC017]MEB3071845.1 hypothetical protein [Mycolicibacter sp. MYC017]